MEKVTLQHIQEGDEGGSCVCIEDWGMKSVRNTYLKAVRQSLPRTSGGQQILGI